MDVRAGCDQSGLQDRVAIDHRSWIGLSPAAVRHRRQSSLVPRPSPGRCGLWQACSLHRPVRSHRSAPASGLGVGLVRGHPGAPGNGASRADASVSFSSRRRRCCGSVPGRNPCGSLWGRPAQTGGGLAGSSCRCPPGCSGGHRYRSGARSGQQVSPGTSQGDRRPDAPPSGIGTGGCERSDEQMARLDRIGGVRPTATRQAATQPLSRDGQARVRQVHRVSLRFG